MIPAAARRLALFQTSPIIRQKIFPSNRSQEENYPPILILYPFFTLLSIFSADKSTAPCYNKKIWKKKKVPP
jgi:hypothetical protein